MEEKGVQEMGDRGREEIIEPGQTGKKRQVGQDIWPEDQPRKRTRKLKYRVETPNWGHEKDKDGDMGGRERFLVEESSMNLEGGKKFKQLKLKVMEGVEWEMRKIVMDTLNVTWSRIMEGAEARRYMEELEELWVEWEDPGGDMEGLETLTIPQGAARKSCKLITDWATTFPV